jgi:hypothetical protein
MAKRQTTKPFLDHDVLTQKEQAKFLGCKEETTANLGHQVPVSKLTEHPLKGQPTNYDSSDTARTFRDPARGQGGLYQARQSAVGHFIRAKLAWLERLRPQQQLRRARPERAWCWFGWPSGVNPALARVWSRRFRVGRGSSR